MKPRHFSLWGALAVLTMGSPVALVQPLHAQAEVPGDEQQGAEVLTRGPVHEAFAETVSYNPEPGLIVKKAPPANIEELPPEQQLEGDNVSWIPGYWAWDDDGSDFLWISGIWRNLPPGRQWVPGYWNDTGDGYQWISGYWADGAATEISYLPEPPATVEAGPNIEAESDDQSWIPGNWYWSDTRYVWRPGYWQTPQTNWIWAPAHYVWTPRGYIYVDGYWDYAVPRRGVIFAPVRFRHDYYSRPGFTYSPLTVISLAVFAEHLFLRPNYGHYYFGDYYDNRYRTNFYPSYAYNGGRRGYDPFFAHQRWENRGNRNWFNQRQEQFQFRRDNENARPPRTFAALGALLKNPQGPGNDPRRNFAIASSFSQYAKNHDGPQRFQPLGQDKRQKIVAQEKEIQRFGQERRKLEVATQTPGGPGPGKRVDSEKMRWNRSPVVAKPVAELSKNEAPPRKPALRPIPPNAGADNGAPGNGNGKGPGVVPGRGERPDGKPGIEPGKIQPGKLDPTNPNRRGNDPSRRIGPNVDPIPDGTVDPKDNPRTLPKVDPTPDRRVNPKGGPNVDPTPDRKVIPKVDPNVDPTPDRKVPKIGPNTDPTPDRKVPKVPNVDPTPDRKIVPKVDPTPERRIAPKVDPTPERRVGPKVDPTPERRIEPRVAPRVNPVPVPERRVAPQPQPQPQPRVAPQPQPQPRPTPQPQPTARPSAPQGPKIGPIPTPGGGGQDRDKKKDKDR